MSTPHERSWLEDSVAGREQSENFAEALADGFEISSSCSGKRQRWLTLIGFDFRAEMLACAGDGESLIVEKGFDAKDVFDIFLAVHALAGAALHGLDLGKFGFPEAENVGRELAELGDFANAEVKLLRNQDVIGGMRFACGFCAGAHVHAIVQPHARGVQWFPSAQRKSLPRGASLERPENSKFMRTGGPRTC